MCWPRCRRRCRVIMRAEQGSFTSAVAERLIGEGIVVLTLLGWWVVARGLPEFILPGPIVVARRLIELFATPEFLWNAFASSWRGLVLIAGAPVVCGGGALLPQAWPLAPGAGGCTGKTVPNASPPTTMGC